MHGSEQMHAGEAQMGLEGAPPLGIYLAPSPKDNVVFEGQVVENDVKKDNGIRQAKPQQVGVAQQVLHLVKVLW